MSMLTQYKVLPIALLHHYLYSMSTAIKRLYHTPAITNKSIAYLYIRHGGSTELDPPTAKEGIRLVREKEKRKAKDPPMFTVASLPRRVGAAR